MRHLTRAGLVIGALSFGSAPAPAEGQGPEPVPQSDYDSDVLSALYAVAGGEDARALAESLAERGSGIFGDLFTILAREQYPPDSKQARWLGPAETQLILETINGFSRFTVRRDLAAFLGEGPDQATSVAALRILGIMGDSEDLEVALRCLETRDGAPLQRRVRKTFENTLAALLERDASTFSALKRSWRKVPRELHAECIKAAARTDDPRGLELLADRLVWDDELRPLAVSLIPDVAPAWDEGLSRGMTLSLTGLLDPLQADVCGSAALALGALGEADSVPLLIDLLEERDVGVRTSAFEALERITECEVPRRAQAWRAWHVLELAWFEEKGDALREDLKARDVGKICTAIRQLSQRGLYRMELARSLRRLLFHLDPAVRCAAARALAGLRAAVAVPELIDSLGDQEEFVRLASLAALRKITGQDHAQDMRAWRAAVPTP